MGPFEILFSHAFCLKSLSELPIIPSGLVALWPLEPYRLVLPPCSSYYKSFGFFALTGLRGSLGFLLLALPEATSIPLPKFQQKCHLLGLMSVTSYLLVNLICHHLLSAFAHSHAYRCPEWSEEAGTVPASFWFFVVPGGYTLSTQ